MHRCLIYPFVLLCWLLVSCTSDGNKATKGSNPSGQETISSAQDAQIDLRTVQLSELKGKKLSKWTFLTRGYFNKAVEITGGKVKVDEVKGQWMKLLDDQRYQLGLDDQITEWGLWEYDNDTDLLHLINHTPGGASSEWKVAAGNDNIVLVGSPKYGNNGTQMKWVRVLPEE